MFISLWSFPCHIKLISNTFLCFSLVVLFFVSWTPVRKPKVGRGRDFFPPLQGCLICTEWYLFCTGAQQRETPRLSFLLCCSSCPWIVGWADSSFMLLFINTYTYLSCPSFSKHSFWVRTISQVLCYYQRRPGPGYSQSYKNRFYSGSIAIGKRKHQNRIGFNFEYNKEKWGLITKEQNGGQWIEITERRHQG